MSVELFGRFDEALKASKAEPCFLRSEASPLPDPLFMVWMPYSQMHEEFIRELANIINKLTGHVERLRAWAVVAAELSDVEKLEACQIAIDDLATISLNLPYVVRSRFYFAGAHLSHQANQALMGEAWVDDLPLDHQIYQDAFDTALAPWGNPAKKLRLALQKIGNATYRDATADFRNAYNHRFSRRFVIGMTDIVTRRPSPLGGVMYAFGGAQPFDLNQVADLLAGQRDACHIAFGRFRKLIEAHAAAIAPVNAKQLADVHSSTL